MKEFTADAERGAVHLYLNLMKRAVTNRIYSRNERDYDAVKRYVGDDWPLMAHTMIGRVRLDNLEECAHTVFKENIPGDFIETGVWRGGSAVFMRAIIKAYESDRTVWAADSFEGLPPPSLPQDEGDQHHMFAELRVSLNFVKETFEAYGLLDEQVKFLKGWFKDTLPSAPIEQLAILRLDGDMYESTRDAIEPLYPKLSRGGFCIVDDYQLKGCKAAIEEYRERHKIQDPITLIDGYGAYWRKA